MSSNLSCPFPESLNPLYNNGFRLSIDKLPTVDFFCQYCALPEIRLQDVVQSTPLSDIPLPGDKLEFEYLNIRFMIDDKLKNYRELYDWIISLGFPRDHSQYRDLIAKSRFRLSSEASSAYSDGVLSILNISSSVVKNIKFIDLLPISLGGTEFNTTDDDPQILTASATFAYTYFTFD